MSPGPQWKLMRFFLAEDLQRVVDLSQKVGDIFLPLFVGFPTIQTSPSEVTPGPSYTQCKVHRWQWGNPRKNLSIQYRILVFVHWNTQDWLRTTESECGINCRKNDGQQKSIRVYMGKKMARPDFGGHLIGHFFRAKIPMFLHCEPVKPVGPLQEYKT